MREEKKAWDSRGDWRFEAGPWQAWVPPLPLKFPRCPCLGEGAREHKEEQSKEAMQDDGLRRKIF